jgi:hypothetical protein
MRQILVDHVRKQIETGIDAGGMARDLSSA